MPKKSVKTRAQSSGNPQRPSPKKGVARRKAASRQSIVREEPVARRIERRNAIQEVTSNGTVAAAAMVLAALVGSAFLVAATSRQKVRRERRTS